MKIDLGCGTVKEPGWTGVDMWEPNSPDIVADIRQKIEVLPDGCADEVRCHHVLEHLGLQEWKDVCFEMARLLKPGGRFTIRVPHPADENAMIHGHIHVLTPHFWRHVAEHDLLEGRLIIDAVDEIENPSCRKVCGAANLDFDTLKHHLRNAFTETVVTGHKPKTSL